MKPTIPRPNGVTRVPNTASAAHPMTAIASASRNALKNPPMEKAGTIHAVTIRTRADTTNRTRCPNILNVIPPLAVNIDQHSGKFNYNILSTNANAPFSFIIGTVCATISVSSVLTSMSAMIAQ